MDMCQTDLYDMLLPVVWVSHSLLFLLTLWVKVFKREVFEPVFKSGKQTAFSFSCPAGSLSDPENISGLAHFCEHMLFLGTEKYPKENEYSQFLSEHAGSSNAFTSGEHTNYYFDVSHEHLQGALDR